MCETHWTYRGDFELEYYGNCDISVTFIQVFSIIIITICAFQACVSAYNIATFDDYKWSTLSQPKSRFSIVFCVSSLGGILYGAARLADPIKNVAGGDVASSIGFTLFFVFGNIGWALLCHIFANFLKKASKVFTKESQAKIDNMEKVTEIMWWRLAAVNWFIIIFPVAAALKPSQSDLVVIAVYILFGVGVTLTSGLLCWVLRTFNAEIGKYVKSDSASVDFIVLQQRTVILYYIGCFGFTLPFTPLCFLMAAWPYLRRKSAYFVMICMFNYTLPAVMVLVMQMKKRKLPSGGKNKVFVTNSQTA